MISDLTQVEKRLERLEKDLKKGRTSDLEREQALLLRSKEALEKELPLRELEMTAEEKKLIRGFMFLSQKPILYALNIGESTTLGDDLEAAVSRFKLDEVAHRPNAGATAICGKVEAELAEMDDEEAAEFLGSYGLRESGLVRLIRKSYELQGLISFFTAGEDECRAWTDSRRLEGAAGRGSDSLRPGAPLHPRRDHSLGHAAGRGLRGRGAQQGHTAPRRQGVRGAGRRRDAHPAQRVRVNADCGSLSFSAPSRRWPMSSAALCWCARKGVERYLRYFVALGAGFLMATAVMLEMMPERNAPESAAGAGADHGRLLRGAPAGAHHQRPLPLWRGDTRRARSSRGTQATRCWPG
jgi:hypothetical protein